MAETTTTTPPIAAAGEAAAPTTEVPASQARKPRGPPLNQIYALPAPIRTYPLPSFYPSNPISLFHLVYTWVKQSLFPPAAEPSIIHEGVWDPDTRSVHIIEPKTIRALWEQGFYGKGSLSRSEPNWLKREQIRRGAAEGDVSEQRTNLRREERRQVKWERARTEQEALERTRLQEALLAAGSTDRPDAPVTEAASVEPEAEVQPSTESEPAPSGAPNEPSTSEPSGDSLDELSITVASKVFGYAKRSTVTMAEFEPELDLPAFPEFPAEEPRGLEPLTSPLDVPVLSTSVTEIVAAITVPDEPVEEPSTFKAPVGPLELLSRPNSLASSHLEPPPSQLDDAVVDVVETTVSATTLEETELVVEAEVSPTASASSDEELSEPSSGHKAPVGPLELLALPNSLAHLIMKSVSALESIGSGVGHVLEEIIEATIPLTESTSDEHSSHSQEPKAPVGPLELLALPNSLAILHLQSQPSSGLTGVTVDSIETVSESTAAELAVADAVPNGLSISKSPVGPLELLALPNSLAMLRNSSSAGSQLDGVVVERVVALTEVLEPTAELESEPEVEASEQDDEDENIAPQANGEAHANGHANGSAVSPDLNGTASPIIKPASSEPVSNGVDEAEKQPQTPLKRRKSDLEDQSVKRRKADAEKQPQLLKRRKSVRFSPKVESTTFVHSDPPSPSRFISTPKLNGAARVAPVAQPDDAVLLEETVVGKAPEVQSSEQVASPPSEVTIPKEEKMPDIENKEHLQLSSEEAFFLSFGLGALSVLDPVTQKPIPQEELLTVFRSHSYFPPREQDLQPDDPFLIHYAVYHHFRSLGWVPRHGIKFGVDWMIYQRGPVFDHAEFGAMVMPAYSDPWWKEQGKQPEKKSWHWLHGVNRVLSHVLKSLVLVYVDVPTPAVFEAAMNEGGIAAALKTYKVREFMVRRWSSNRNR